jgi:uncharacterized RDD family membrane protein YckC
MTTVPAAPPSTLTIGRQGHYAGAVSRLAAFAADVGISWGLFTAGVALLSVATELFIGQKVTLTHHQILAITAVTIWEFVYFAYSWGVSGKTLGMALLGLQVVTAAGGRITTRQASIRTLGLVLGFLTLGIGFLGILFQRDRRAVQDFVAGTCVVYSWDARAARLRFMSHTEFPAKDSTESTK